MYYIVTVSLTGFQAVECTLVSGMVGLALRGEKPLEREIRMEYCDTVPR